MIGHLPWPPRMAAVFVAGETETTAGGVAFSVRAYDAGAVTVAVDIDIKPQSCPNPLLVVSDNLATLKSS